MQPLGKHVKNWLVHGSLLSTMIRVPYCSCTGLGTVTRKIFFGMPSGSISAAATTGTPVSVRASRPVKQTFGALASWPFWPGVLQNLVHGEYTSGGMSAWGGVACAAGAGWAAAGFCAAGAAAFGAAAGAAGFGAAGLGGAAGGGC